MGFKPRRNLAAGSEIAAQVANVLATERRSLLTLANAVASEKDEIRAHAERLHKKSQELYELANQLTNGVQRKHRVRVTRNVDPQVLAASLKKQLKAHGGNVSAIAREMNTTRIQVHRWCKRFNLSLDDYRGPPFELGQ